MLQIGADFSVLSGKTLTRESCYDQDSLCASLDSVLDELLCPDWIHVGDVREEGLLNTSLNRQAICERTFLRCVGEDDREATDSLCCDVCSSQPGEELDYGKANSCWGFIGHLSRSRHTRPVEGLSPWRIACWLFGGILLLRLRAARGGRGGSCLWL